MLGRLPEAIPELKSYSFGADLGIAAGNHDFAVVADVEGEEGFRAYQEHPDHQAVLAVIRPMLADRAAVQFTL
ncbi:Dabb family protein [Thermobifida cellulosilytica]|uniref:Dabb family protein n=1 Tax=Thermobifida cellulosilytica TaxID=144786 RepID=UPI000A018D79